MPALEGDEETTGSLWFYSKDEVTNFNTDIANTNNFKSSKYKVKLLGSNLSRSSKSR